ncbi:MAG: class I mannose-6-phosphate isomerase [Clostridia bacterium]|nr:class I mannose-6-phosphate isomerase [Clostridia bacterium]
MSSVLYPMQLSPVCRSTIWGGNKMRDAFNFQSKLDNIAEAWMLSAREDAPGFIINGEYMGAMLHELLREHPEMIAAGSDGSCPLLIKFIDAKDKLSIQVHPDDAYAISKGIGRGKTEMWIVLEASRGAELIYGLNGTYSADELRDAISGGTLESLMRRVPVKAGDVFYIPAGLIHAIGGGILLAEIQQNCDTTYRVYDYNRRQADGSLRALHIDDAVACTKNFTDADIDAFRCEHGRTDALADSKYFWAEMHDLRADASFTVGDSFVSLLVTNGEGALVYGGEEYPLSAGISYFLPAGMGDYTVKTQNGELLTVILSGPNAL